jgi:FtsP/CotA-like multicopper oxidase with cupredoxin domain
MKLFKFVPVIALAVAACGGGDAPPAETPPEAPAPAPAGPVAPTGAMTIPDWYGVDHDARTVAIELTAGATADNNYWNYNGFTKGQIAITVPEGYTVEITLINQDPNMAHSVGISAELANFMLMSPDPVFAGAISENPQSMIDSTMPGETETITFVADAAGNYSMVCYIAGHSAVGMWLFFNVSSDGQAGVQGL